MEKLRYGHRHPPTPPRFRRGMLPRTGETGPKATLPPSEKGRREASEGQNRTRWARRLAFRVAGETRYPIVIVNPGAPTPRLAGVTKPTPVFQEWDLQFGTQLSGLTLPTASGRPGPEGFTCFWMR